MNLNTRKYNEWHVSLRLPPGPRCNQRWGFRTDTSTKLTQLQPCDGSYCYAMPRSHRGDAKFRSIMFLLWFFETWDHDFHAPTLFSS